MNAIVNVHYAIIFQLEKPTANKHNLDGTFMTYCTSNLTVLPVAVSISVTFRMAKCWVLRSYRNIKF